jgi:glycosyltransferase involved in cell wall biosynthesis
MLRIGYYVTSTTVGGLERHVLALIERLRSTHHIEVFCDDGDGAQFFRRELDDMAIKPHLLRGHTGPTHGILRPTLTGLPIVGAARKAFVDARLDLIHFHAGQLGFMYAPTLASCLAGVPRRILTLHNPVFRHSPLRGFVERRVLGRLSRIVTVTDYMKRELIEKKGVDPDHIRVISNGVEIEEFKDTFTRAEALAALGIPDDRLVVGFVGRLHHLKGLDLLIEAVPLVKERFSRVEFVIVGSGPEEESLKQLARERGVSETVRFAGYRRNAWRFMPAFDVVVLPSRDEAQSIALLEAMACGKPVVAARVGGVPEVVEDRVTGLLYPAGDVPALAAALIDVLKDASKRASMGAAGQRRVGDRFSRAEMLRQTIAMYETVFTTASFRRASENPS